MGKAKQLAQVLGSLEGFTTKENWDRFIIAIRDGNYAFEWYEDWSELQGPLLSNLPKPESQPYRCKYSCPVAVLPTCLSTSMMPDLRPSPTLTYLRSPFPTCCAAMRVYALV